MLYFLIMKLYILSQEKQFIILRVIILLILFYLNTKAYLVNVTAIQNKIICINNIQTAQEKEFEDIFNKNVAHTPSTNLFYRKAIITNTVEYPWEGIQLAMS